AGELRGKLTLILDALQNARPALLQLAQISETRLQRPQLRVVEAAGLLLAIAGDERHRRPLVHEGHRCRDLPHGDAEFRGNALTDLVHMPLNCPSMRSWRPASRAREGGCTDRE